ncbi:MAG: hypothetical protein EOR03_01825 [Mesorhizobium sp.]|nr:MAG: hypothetical protein EOR03_01825 [Mesorhizobium sp.]
MKGDCIARLLGSSRHSRLGHGAATSNHIGAKGIGHAIDCRSRRAAPDPPCRAPHVKHSAAGAAGEAADLPPCGGDARQGRGGYCPSDLSTDYSHALRLFPVGNGLKSRGGDPSHPPLSCRTSPPQGGRLDAALAFANHQR